VSGGWTWKTLLAAAGIGGGETCETNPEKCVAAEEDLQALVTRAQQQYPGKAGTIEEHHPISKYLGGDPNQELEPLDAAYHQVITNAFREAYAYGQRVPSPERLVEILRQVYSQFPLPK